MEYIIGTLLYNIQLHVYTVYALVALFNIWKITQVDFEWELVACAFQKLHGKGISLKELIYTCNSHFCARTHPSIALTHPCLCLGSCSCYEMNKMIFQVIKLVLCHAQWTLFDPHLAFFCAEGARVPLWGLESHPKSRRGILRRAVFSEEQRKELERTFRRQKYISKTDRHRLAADLCLKETQVDRYVH